jgi:hypothetical protein
MNNKLCGHEEKKYRNSWLFTPIADDILMWKYLPETIFNPRLGAKMHFISATMFDNTLNSKLNIAINSSKNQADRVIWELGNQQVFFSKDRVFVANCIRDFLQQNQKEESLSQPHIRERWNQMAKDIEEIPDKYPYFLHKNSSCDDTVEYWFYDHKKQRGRSLKRCKDYVTEFVIVEDGRIKEFISNLDYLRT